MGDSSLDLSVLESMFGDDADLRSAILEEFANCATPYMEELDAAIACQSVEGVKSLAHKLKSSSRTVGAIVLGDLCERLESSAPNGDWQNIYCQESALKDELERVLNYIHGL